MGEAKGSMETRLSYTSHTHAPPDSSWVQEVVQVEVESSFGRAPPPGMGWKIPLAPQEK
jgi:hypothetical protein